MTNIYIYITLTIFGMCFGSFAGASVWRLRAKQLEQDILAGENVNKIEFKKLKKLTKKTLLNDHSQCLNCDYELKWYDMIPIVSWISLTGKCRKCSKPIGIFEPIMEISMALFFVLSYSFWPFSLVSYLDIARLVIWLLAGICFMIMFAYDKKWFIIPNLVSYLTIILGFVYLVIVILISQDKMSIILNVLMSILILSGIYLFLYLISKGKWIGFGDIKLGLGLALFVIDWRLAFVALFSANLIGCVLVLPSLILGKLKRNSRGPFGPLLIIGAILAFFVGKYIVNAYFSLL